MILPVPPLRYLIATNYLLGFDEKFKAINHNFVETDTVQAAKAGKLGALVDKEFSQALENSNYSHSLHAWL